jgi:prepilin-type N-terminal cleavage/methylation domain-containing protein
MRRRERKGFTLLEIVPVLTIVAFLATIVILSLNPKKQFLEARNSARKNDIAHIADAIAEYSRDKSTDLLMSIPTGSAQELCADLLTGSCSLMVNLRDLYDLYLEDVPVDPLSEDPDSINEHSRYFIIRRGNRITISAPDTEPAGAEDLTVSR